MLVERSKNRNKFVKNIFDQTGGIKNLVNKICRTVPLSHHAHLNPLRECLKPCLYLFGV